MEAFKYFNKVRVQDLKKQKKKAESKKNKQKRRNHCAVSREKPRERDHIYFNEMWIYDFTIFVFSICFLYLDSAYLLQLISVALNSHFHKLSKFINVFVFIKGNILRSVVVVIENNFPSMFYKNNFSHCEVTHKQCTFCPQHLILSWGFFGSQEI